MLSMEISYNCTRHDKAFKDYCLQAIVPVHQYVNGHFNLKIAATIKIFWGKRFLYHLSNTKTYVIMHINGNCQGNSKFNSRCIISGDGLLCTASHDVGKWNKQNNNKYFSLIFQLSLLGDESTFFQTDVTQKMSCLIFDESWIQDYESRSFPWQLSAIESVSQIIPTFLAEFLKSRLELVKYKRHYYILQVWCLFYDLSLTVYELSLIGLHCLHLLIKILLLS